ncbi:Nucleoside-diphosphate-sugar epimerase [Daejeonella rubra]|uniref:Nucleoside-diphosphate-sugar epimerase n=1 Tax=Daejeonella rubra TaxID=990371 RepID=A0A1G9Q636_9SPHI|nr:SDR family oxidoreductase [Daejeonella rubra]SDM05795.1 Nucleoside-diphosphate-sugar epimerase [Daejeonella rubra]
MENKGTISLLGCGWLGFPLALNLISRGFKVKGSTTSPDKLAIFKESGIDPYLVQFDTVSNNPDLHDFLDADILIVSVPPGRGSIDGMANYRKMAETIKDQLVNSRVSRLIFISSTSVYPDSNSILTEFSSIDPETESGIVLAETEALLSSLNMKVILLRLSGLIGPKRMPGRFFAGKTNIPNGLAPVNMIHQDDVISLINCLIDFETAEGVYIGCSPSHPSKEEFYTLAASSEQLNPPTFISEKLRWKLISSERTNRELNFTYKYPSLMDWLRKI